MTYTLSSTRQMTAEPFDPEACPTTSLNMERLNDRFHPDRFTLVGQFLGFVGDREYSVKYLKLQTQDGEFTIKLAKILRHLLSPQLTRLAENLPTGTWIQVSGELKPRKGDRLPKLKATRIERVDASIHSGSPRADSPATAHLTQPVPSQPPASPKPASNQGKILICQKSKCWNRGGKEVCQSLQRMLAERELDDQIQIKLTGCMDQCGQGPNLVVMPTKSRYTQVRSQDVEKLVNENFSA
jgi:(2Fe-2S) ferredoxin